ncbi:MAG: transposase [Giesbergeria sp.]|uniref:RNA-guided endonuclease InsQ/TnpB family protein n=1 Tax=Giesbergeria sp. TaxID=2818473 RepID=UPI002637B009|nr:transposase [Giesbergeria sp.]MDD2609720.1 transposase [Giesbergeria sp.]
MFSFEPIKDETGKVTHHLLHLGTKKHPLGCLAFTAHRDYALPASIHLSIHAGHRHVSFNYDDGIAEPSVEEITQWLRSFSTAELSSVTLGLDRGVQIPLAASNGQQFDFRAIEKKRLVQQEKHKKRWQRRQARRMQGSRRWKKAQRRVAQCQQYATDLRRDFCHQTSHALVADPAYKLYVLEALKVKNMTTSAKGDAEKPGKNVQQKAGLNRAILASGWGQIKVYTHYKALRAGKLCIEVPAHYSSQECSHCGFTHPDNRRSQAAFVCQSCHCTDNADTNAAKVLVKRGVALMLGEDVAKKKVKRGRVKKQKVGAECSKPAGATQPTLVETWVNRPDGNILAFQSMKRETPATTLCV